jgi:hypothetical protein
MERMLLVWDELDDLVGVTRCLVARAMMRINPPTARADSVATALIAGTLLVTQRSLIQLW